jgi:uncharacterized protein (TIGR03032 family)
MPTAQQARQAIVLGAPMSGADLVSPSAGEILVVRDPRTAVGALAVAWESRRFVRDPQPAGWWGTPWSFGLIEGWEALRGEPISVVCARQWFVLQIAAMRAAGEHAVLAVFEELVADPRDAETSLTRQLGCQVKVHLAEPGDPWARPFDLSEVLAGLSASHDLWEEYLGLVEQRGGPTALYRQVLPDARREQVPGRQPSAGTPFQSGFTPGVPELLQKTGTSVLITTYKAGQAIVARTHDGVGLDTQFTPVERAMGSAVSENRLALGSADAVSIYMRHDGVQVPADPVPDLAWVPKAVVFTGDIAIHDMSWDSAGELWMVNTRFSCLSVLSAYSSFDCRWRPPWITALAAEDRCHLNGLAMRDGSPAYVTALAMTDVAGGWRAHKGSAGVLVDIREPLERGLTTGGEVIASGLSMPHSPRWHEGRVWFCTSGTGALCVLEADGSVVEVTRLPGFTRGLTFIGPYALVGLSQVRESVFTGLPVTASADERNCGVWVVDIRTGAVAAFLQFTGSVTEVFDVQVIGARWPHIAEPGGLTKTCYALDPETLKHLATHEGTSA